jgi:hypothetical protein
MVDIEYTQSRTVNANIVMKEIARLHGRLGALEEKLDRFLTDYRRDLLAQVGTAERELGTEPTTKQLRER